jgi:hypothetical protein
MKRKLLLLAISFSVMVTTAPALADGDFYVVASGGGVGTKITSLPYEIKTPGFYYVTGNLACASGTGITVNADNVTLDLMGFCLNGDNRISDGIVMDGRKNVEIRNGTLRNWFAAINDTSLSGNSYRIINIRAESNMRGIILAGSSQLIKGCTLVDIPTGTGIYSGGIISGNVVANCATGIYCLSGSVIGNSVSCNSDQFGISLHSVNPIVMDANTVIGDGGHYGGGGTATRWSGWSLTYPYGNNAGHP